MYTRPVIASICGPQPTDPADKRITGTLVIVEAMLAADTPNGRAYRRYDVDGYGNGWTAPAGRSASSASAALAGQASLQLVRRYPDGGWEPATRTMSPLGTPGPATLRLSGAHLSRLAAAGRQQDR
jgi:hypothetical protein